MEEKFTGYKKGTKDGVVTFKCFFTCTDREGFEYTKVKYLKVDEFEKIKSTLVKKGA